MGGGAQRRARAFSQAHSGLVAAAHARKLLPWVSRLRSAQSGLREARKRSDPDAVVQQLSDLWFWIGRLTGEALAVSEDPQHRRLQLQVLRAVLRAQEEAHRARRFLATRGSGAALQVGRLRGSFWRRGQTFLSDPSFWLVDPLVTHRSLGRWQLDQVLRRRGGPAMRRRWTPVTVPEREALFVRYGAGPGGFAG